MSEIEAPPTPEEMAAQQAAAKAERDRQNQRLKQHLSEILVEMGATPAWEAMEKAIRAQIEGAKGRLFDDVLFSKDAVNSLEVERVRGLVNGLEWPLNMMDGARKEIAKLDEQQAALDEEPEPEGEVDW